MEKDWDDRDIGSSRQLILLALLKEGPLTLKELEAKTGALTAPFRFPRDPSQRRVRRKAKMGASAACKSLLDKQFVCLGEDGKYSLTESGKAKAERSAKAMDRGMNILENQLLSPSATARNTIVGYVVLAALKLAVGLFGGSVGLVADGADTSVDSASAGVVWLGIRFKRELVGTIAVLALMFATAATLVYESANSIIENVNGTFVPMSIPYVVIIVEGIALLGAFVFSIYQRFVGRRSKSLALISQSIDSKNSMYSAAAVIVGAVFSIVGIHWVDAVVGGFIAVRITWDGLGLTREAIAVMRGRQPDFAQYKLPFEKQIEMRRLESFRHWILYAMREENLSTREEIVGALERAFRPKYMPELVTEFTVGKLFDFDNNFAEIVQPLVEKEYVGETDGVYALTDKGRVYIKSVMSNVKYKQSEL